MNNKYKYLIISLISITLSYIYIDISIYFVLILILWILGYLILYTNIFRIPFLKDLSILVVISTIVIINVGTVILTNESGKETPTKPITKEQCAPIYQEYNSKILDISGDGIRGTVGIVINEEDCKANVNYNLIYTADIPKNYTFQYVTYSEYKYAGGMRSPSEGRDMNIGTGEIYPVFKNKDLLPDVFDFGTQDIDHGSSMLSENANTTTFYQGWMSIYNFREDSLEKIMSKTIYEIMDGSSYIMEEELEGGGISTSLDTTRTSEEGPVVKTFEISYTER